MTLICQLVCQLVSNTCWIPLTQTVRNDQFRTRVHNGQPKRPKPVSNMCSQRSTKTAKACFKHVLTTVDSKSSKFTRESIQFMHKWSFWIITLHENENKNCCGCCCFFFYSKHIQIQFEFFKHQCQREKKMQRTEKRSQQRLLTRSIHQKKHITPHQ